MNNENTDTAQQNSHYATVILLDLIALPAIAGFHRLHCAASAQRCASARAGIYTPPLLFLRRRRRRFLLRRRVASAARYEPRFRSCTE